MEHYTAYADLHPIVHPGTVVHTFGHPHDEEGNVIHSTRPLYFMALLSSSDACMPIVGAFCSGQWSACLPLPVYINLFSNLLNRSSSIEPDRLAFTLHGHMTLLLVHQLSFLGQFLVGTNHCIPVTSYKICDSSH